MLGAGGAGGRQQEPGAVRAGGGGVEREPRAVQEELQVLRLLGGGGVFPVDVEAVEAEVLHEGDGG